MEDKITRCISDIQVHINEIRKVLEYNRVHFVFAYKPRNAEFRRLPSILKVSLPSFIPQKVDQDLIHKLSGFMSELPIGTDSPIVGLSGAQSSPSYIPLIE